MPSLAWGARVSSAFASRVIEIADQIGVDPDWLMACMAFESGGTFSPSIVNKAGSGAVGLIQIMPSTARALGTTVEDLAAMTAEGQLEYVLKYFLPYQNRLQSIEDTYMAILWPSAVGKPSDYVLFDRNDESHPKRYIQNAGLDWNKDGQITKAEACRRVVALLDEGQLPGNALEP